MSIYLRGKSWHYRFLLKDKDYFGPCPGCETEAQAKDYEHSTKENIRKEAASLEVENEKVKHDKVEISPVYPASFSDALTTLINRCSAIMKPHCRSVAPRWKSLKHRNAGSPNAGLRVPRAAGFPHFG